MEIGYQRELGYKHPDGSYSAFGLTDGQGSTWLTAYVARSFQQAQQYIHIDTNIIKQAMNFLVSKQANNGCFQEFGRLVDFSQQNLFALSAFVLLAFLESQVS